MPSLPTVGADSNTWGAELNAFLSVAHGATTGYLEVIDSTVTQPKLEITQTVGNGTGLSTGEVYYPTELNVTITATEQTAIDAVMRTRQQLVQQQAQIEARIAEIAADLEKRLRLPVGALGENATHRVNLDEMRVEPIPED